MAERWRFLPFVLFGLFMSTVLYPVYANWVWDGGWLARLGVTCGLGHGHVDFAGSSVVHMAGGGAALVGAWLIGPRLGKFRADGRANPLPAHNVPMYMTGTLILTFGWFGFNTGAALRDGDPIVARVAVNTILACAAGAFASMTYTWALVQEARRQLPLQRRPGRAGGDHRRLRLRRPGGGRCSSAASPAFSSSAAACSSNGG